MFVRSKVVKGLTYYQLVEGYRDSEGRVRHRNLASLGRHPTIEDAIAAGEAGRSDADRRRVERLRAILDDQGRRRKEADESASHRAQLREQLARDASRQIVGRLESRIKQLSAEFERRKAELRARYPEQEVGTTSTATVDTTATPATGRKLSDHERRVRVMLDHAERAAKEREEDQRRINEVLNRPSQSLPRPKESFHYTNRVMDECSSADRKPIRRRKPRTKDAG
jgi:hypothetical protein